MAVELNDTTIPATYQLAERTGTQTPPFRPPTKWPKGRGHCPRGAPLDADLTDCCCEHGPAARVAIAV
jgi:hypothetical protein